MPLGQLAVVIDGLADGMLRRRRLGHGVDAPHDLRRTWINGSLMPSAPRIRSRLRSEGRRFAVSINDSIPTETLACAATCSKVQPRAVRRPLVTLARPWRRTTLRPVGEALLLPSAMVLARRFGAPPKEDSHEEVIPGSTIPIGNPSTGSGPSAVGQAPWIHPRQWENWTHGQQPPGPESGQTEKRNCCSRTR
jgi:hypothetical protein